MDVKVYADKINWSLLTGYDWANLLLEQPQYADKCDWRKLSFSYWIKLLSRRPEFAVNFNLYNILLLKDWMKLLSVAPLLSNSEFCNWGKLKEKATLQDWTYLLSKQPQFHEYFTRWNRLSSKQWVSLLIEQPRFESKVNWKNILDEDLRLLVSNQIYFLNNDNIVLLSGNDWVNILRKHPRLVDKCDFAKFTDYDWQRLLLSDISFIDRCDYSKLPSYTQIDVFLKLIKISRE